MRIESINIPNPNKLVADYRSSNETIMQYFDYNPFESDVFQDRVNDIDQKHVNRNELADILHKMNKKWNAPSSSLTRIEQLRDDHSLVVIGGQQAGLLTGPMYTINKVISIIHLARQQEELLQVPVIPIFWIAGEDHDFDEINHVFLSEASKMRKHKLAQYITEKKAVSNIALDKELAIKWVDQLFGTLDETVYTKDLYNRITEYVETSETYVDFFAQLIFHLFEQEGIILVNSNDSELRKLESSYFVNLIENQEETTKAINDNVDEITKLGYSLSIDTDSRDTNIFYQNGEERVLLVVDKDGNWIGKNQEVLLTKEEILSIAKNNPELLSNNVMTRPLMQEMVFPTLAFIGGPGELSYWSVLRDAFHIHNLKMPPVIPRLSFTFIERQIDKLLRNYDISPEFAIKNGVEEVKRSWLVSKSNPPIEKITEELRQTITEAHQPIRDLAKTIRSDIGDLADKNLEFLLRDVTFIEKRMGKAINDKFTKEIGEFDRLQLALHPHDGLQERVWNPLPWINRYGKDFITKLSKQSCSYENVHFIVYL